jgi:hypothetical protein
MEIAAIAISGVSFLLSVISFVVSLKSQHLQDKVNEMELKLKNYELAEKEKEQHKTSCVEARIIHITKDDYRIKVWNSGNAPAKNVNATWEKESRFVFFDKEKLPFELLEPQKSFELRISPFSGSPRKLCITTSWEDDKGEIQSKVQWSDL